MNDSTARDDELVDDFSDDVADAMMPLGEVLLRIEVERLQRLVDSLLRHQGATPKECTGCGAVVRHADVVVGSADVGHRIKRRVVLEEGSFQRHRKKIVDERGDPLVDADGNELGCPCGC